MPDELELAPSVASEEPIVATPEPVTGEEQAEGETPPEETPEEAEKKSRNQRRKEAKERNEAALRESEQARHRAERLLEYQKAAAAKLPEPKQSDYPSYEQFQAALSAYHVVKMTDSREIARIDAEASMLYQQADAIRRQQQQSDDDNWASQYEDARTRYPDFDRVAMRQDVPGMITPPLARMIAQSDVGADLAYFIGQNPELGQQISRMAAVDMARAVGRLEAQVSAPKPKSVTTAPEPIAPVRGKSNPVKAPENMSYDEYKAARKAGKL